MASNWLETSLAVSTEKSSVAFITYIYIYAFSRRFYPKRLTGYIQAIHFFFLDSTCVPWESNPQPLRS